MVGGNVVTGGGLELPRGGGSARAKSTGCKPWPQSCIARLGSAFKDLLSARLLTVSTDTLLGSASYTHAHLFLKFPQQGYVRVWGANSYAGCASLNVSCPPWPHAFELFVPS